MLIFYANMYKKIHPGIMGDAKRIVISYYFLPPGAKIRG